MKIPINFLLYVASLGMLAQAGWLFYQATPGWGADPLTTYIDRGLKQGRELVEAGKGAGRQDRRYPYHVQDWWMQFKEFNCIGELPPPPEEITKTEVVEPASTTQDTPIGEICVLRYVMYDSSSDPEESETLVGLSYKPEAGVEVPADLRPKASTPGDAMPLGSPSQKTGGLPASSPLPTFGNQELIHWVQRGESLWPPYDHIKLSRVAEDAMSAWFVRVGSESEPTGEPEEERLWKQVLDLDQEILASLGESLAAERALRANQRQSQPGTASGGNSSWVDVDETKMVNGQYHISKKDQQMFRQNSEDLLRSVSVAPYTPRYGNQSLRGLEVVNVDAGLAGRFGVQRGDVLLALNDVPIRTRAQAINEGRKQYDRGVRTFKVTMLTAGQVVDRYYQAPDQ